MDIRWYVAYYMHVMLDEGMYVYEWKRWMWMLDEQKKRELEMMKKMK